MRHKIRDLRPETEQRVRDVKKPHLDLFGFLSRVLCLVSVFLCLMSRVSSLYACPMCANLLERSKDAVKMLRFSTGISWSILLMLSVPYLIIGSAVFIIWRSNKKKQHESLPRP